MSYGCPEILDAYYSFNKQNIGAGGWIFLLFVIHWMAPSGYKSHEIYSLYFMKYTNCIS